MFNTWLSILTIGSDIERIFKVSNAIVKIGINTITKTTFAKTLANVDLSPASILAVPVEAPPVLLVNLLNHLSILIAVKRLNTRFLTNLATK